MPYTIIGIDGKEYGPVGEEDLRRWIAEGRLNAQSMAKGEQDPRFQPLSAFPEFADALARQAPPSPAPSLPPPPANPAELVTRDYDLAIDGCMAGGWNLVKKTFWPSVGAVFLVVLISGLIGQVLGLVTRPTIEQMMYQHQFTPGGIFLICATSVLAAPIHIVLYAGVYRYFLKLKRGQSATLGDAFSGFGPSFGQLVLLGWVQALLVFVGMALCFLPGIYFAVAWAFATPLVIDRRMGFWEAMELSRKMVSKHWFVVFGFMIVYTVVVLAGLLGCCIGIFVTIPIGMAALMCAYETIFSPTQNQ